VRPCTVTFSSRKHWRLCDKQQQYDNKTIATLHDALPVLVWRCSGRKAFVMVWQQNWDLDL